MSIPDHRPGRRDIQQYIKVNRPEQCRLHPSELWLVLALTQDVEKKEAELGIKDTKTVALALPG